MLPNIKCFMLRLCAPSNRQNQPQSWNSESAKTQGAEHRDNLKGKYVVGFSHENLQGLSSLHLDFTSPLPKGHVFKKSHFLMATFNKNVVAAKYCEEITAVLFLQECIHVTEKLSCSQNQFTNRDTHCSLPR